MPGPCSKPIMGKTATKRSRSLGEPTNISKKLALRLADFNTMTKNNPKFFYRKPGSNKHG